MIKKSKLRITLVIFSALALLLLATVGIIYFATSHQLTQRNRDMLSLYAEQYWVNGNPTLSQEGPPSGKPSDTSFISSTFFSITLHSDNSIDIVNDKPSLYSNEELTSISSELSSQTTGYGTTDELAYLIEEKNDERLIVLMSNSSLDESKQILLQTTLIYAAIIIPFLALLSWLAGSWTLSPMQKSYNKQKQFIADAGHELKTPISTINANLELLNRDIGENRWLSNITYENERMSELVKQLLELAKLDNVNFSTELLNMSRLVTASILPFESLSFEQGNTLNYNICDDLMLVGNKLQLEQLVSILIDNALTHCSSQGTINVSLTNSHNHAVLRVANESEPISSEQASHLFERFYRIDNARQEHNKHYGLGLSIAKAITDVHKGKLSVTNEHDFVTFTALLPCQKRS